MTRINSINFRFGVSNSLTIIFSLLCFTAIAQRIDYNKIILPASAVDVSFEEKLVQLAWANDPANLSQSKLVDVATYNTKIASRSWTNLVTATLNVNEYTINPPQIEYPLYYPRYNFGLSLSLGSFFVEPLKTKRANVERDIAIENVNSRKIKIRAEVRRRYQTYLADIEMLKVQVDALEDAITILTLAEQKFRKNEITLDEYNRSLGNFNDQKSKKILSEKDVMISKINIEEVIGIKLEDVN